MELQLQLCRVGLHRNQTCGLGQPEFALLVSSGVPYSPRNFGASLSCLRLIARDSLRPLDKEDELLLSDGLLCCGGPPRHKRTTSASAHKRDNT